MKKSRVFGDPSAQTSKHRSLLTPIRKTIFCANNHFQPIHHACQNGKHIKLQLWIGELRGS